MKALGKGIDHVELGVTDMERSVAFYRDLLGLRPLPGATAQDTWLDAGTGRIRLVATGTDPAPSGWANSNLQGGFRHVGFKEADVDARSATLRDAGVEFTIEPRDAIGDVRLSFFYDPDGTLLELVEGAIEHHDVFAPEHREAKAAGLPARGEPPHLDHVAVTVADLDAALGFWTGAGAEPVGTLVFGDEQGFVIHDLWAGPLTLEVFSYDVATEPSPWRADPALLGIRALGVPTADVAALVAGGAREAAPDLIEAPDGVAIATGAA